MKMFGVRSILLFFGATVVFNNCKADTCINHDPCVCQLNENDKIDISGLLDGIKSPTFLHDTEGNITYTFLGCKDANFDTTNGTISATLIRTNNTMINSTPIGTAGISHFGKLADQYVITYINDNKTEIQPTIILLCDNVDTPFLKILDDENQKLLLSSPKLCIIQTEKHGMSGGSVFLLILFLLALFYFVGGAALLYFIRGARGAELIPNVDFWRNLPGLVKDGLIFLLSGCKPNFVTTAETYDRI